MLNGFEDKINVIEKVNNIFSKNRMKKSTIFFNEKNEKVNNIFQRIENIVGKGENAGYQHFLLFPQRFHEISSSGR